MRFPAPPVPTYYPQLRPNSAVFESFSLTPLGHPFPTVAILNSVPNPCSLVLLVCYLFT